VKQRLNAKQHEREAGSRGGGQPAAVTIATNMAGRGYRHLLERGVNDVGGLHIIGLRVMKPAHRQPARGTRGARRPRLEQIFISLETT